MWRNIIWLLDHARTQGGDEEKGWVFVVELGHRAGRRLATAGAGGAGPVVGEGAG